MAYILVDRPSRRNSSVDLGLDAVNGTASTSGACALRFASEALSAWRERGAAIIHVRHESPPDEGVFLVGTPGVEFKPEAAPLPSEPVITKHVNSAFIGTDLVAYSDSPTASRASARSTYSSMRTTLPSRRV
jgi:nicotinamidase-related amidase